MFKKYILTNEIKQIKNKITQHVTTLYRIQALRDFGEVYGHARVSGTAEIYGSVYDRAKISHKIKVWSKVYGTAILDKKNKISSIKNHQEVYKGRMIVDINNNK
ncbi:hypothetical protein [Bartonella rattaustraliani]|uniref:hypothetical protein n=1 Tax=Bartonella rattaustraliani TaxID=481139 RepID=UPI0003151A10|nr:hypothetical protein [Bartonella rattaustraliani]